MVIKTPTSLQYVKKKSSCAPQKGVKACRLGSRASQCLPQEAVGSPHWAAGQGLTSQGPFCCPQPRSRAGRGAVPGWGAGSGPARGTRDRHSLRGLRQGHGDGNGLRLVQESIHGRGCGQAAALALSWPWASAAKLRRGRMLSGLWHCEAVLQPSWEGFYTFVSPVYEN